MLIHAIEIKNSYEKKILKFFVSSTEPPIYFSRLFLVIGNYALHFQPFEHKILNYSLTAYECKSKYTYRIIVYKSDFSFKPPPKKFLSIMDINILEYPFQYFIQVLIQSLLNHPLTLVKGLNGYKQQDVSFKDI